MPTTLDPFLDAISKVEAAGATPTVIWMSPTTWTTLAKIKTGAGSNQPVLVPSTSPGSAPVRSIAGVPVVVPQASPTPRPSWPTPPRSSWSCAATAGSRSTSSVKFLNDGVAVRLTMRLGFAVPYPTAVVRIKDVP